MLWNENDISMVMKEVDLNGESEGGVLQSYYFSSVAIERSVTSSLPLLLCPSCFTKHTLTLFAVHSRIFSSPHLGSSGVPFMNRMQGAELTRRFSLESRFYMCTV